MGILWRTCATLCAFSVFARGLTIRDEDNRISYRPAAKAANFDFDFVKRLEKLYNEDVDEFEKSDEDDGAESARNLEPEAEMLPAHFEGIRSPGVDHMEMRLDEKDTIKPAQSQIKTTSVHPAAFGRNQRWLEFDFGQF